MLPFFAMTPRTPEPGLTSLPSSSRTTVRWSIVISLRIVLGYTHARVVDSACAAIPVHTTDIGDDGLIADPTLHDEIANVLTQLADDVAD